MNRAIVFGARGALGSAIVDELAARGWHVDRAGRSASPGIDVAVDEPEWTSKLTEAYHGIIWSQGINMQGGVLDASDQDFHESFDANVAFIPRSLQQLDQAGLLADDARAVIVSSVWQLGARASKAAYIVSKAAAGGLVRAMVADLAGRLQVNAVLPGVIDTPMTRANLSPEQIHTIEADTPGGRLATPEHVGRTAAWLVDPASAGVTGQSIVVDNGWSTVRSV